MKTKFQNHECDKLGCGSLTSIHTNIELCNILSYTFILNRRKSWLSGFNEAY